MVEHGLTEQQRRWRESVRASLETATGRSLEEWKRLLAASPETAPRARQRWAKETHGLGQNYYMMVAGELAADAGAVAPDAQALGAALWRDPGAAEIFRAVEAVVAELPDVVLGQRKAFSSFSRRHAFAAARPVRGAVSLGLALDPAHDPRLRPPRREGWSERLTAVLDLAAREEVDQGVAHLLRSAWERS